MARGTQHRKRRPRPDARLTPTPPSRRARARQPEWEQRLFFSRLRTHGRWIFALLALAFAVSFVILGVGSGSTGIGQVIGNLLGSGSSASGSSLASLQQQTVKHPKSATAWFNYANQLEVDHDDDTAITALTQYLALRPHDQNEILDLAALDSQRAQDWFTLYTNTEALETAVNPTGAGVDPSGSSPLATGLTALAGPLSTALTSTISADASNEYEQVITYLGDRVTAYQKLVAVTPGNAYNEYSLAQAAQTANDTSVAIAAYKSILKLSPNNPLASSARSEIKALKGAA